MSQKRILKARDIERLENTSFATPTGVKVDGAIIVCTFGPCNPHTGIGVCCVSYGGQCCQTGQQTGIGVCCLSIDGNCCNLLDLLHVGGDGQPNPPNLPGLPQ